MKKGIVKYTAIGLAGAVIVAHTGIAGAAGFSGFDTALVGLSSNVSKKSEPLTQEKASEGAAVQTLVGISSNVPEQEAQNTAAPVQTIDGVSETVEDQQVPETPQVSELSDEHIEAQSIEEGPESLDTSMVGTTGFAQCEEYLNVRSGASADSEAVGKIYNNGSLEILGVEQGGWYQVRSGNVEGYVSADYVAIGSEAEAIAETAGYTTASVGADCLNVRADAGSDADIIATIDGSNEIEVVEDLGDWVKVILDGEMYGYVSSDYVATTTEYATGETLEEEQERLDQEWLAYLAEQEAQQAAAEAAYLAAIEAQNTYTDTYSYNDGSSYTDYSYSAPTVNTTGSADELAAQAQTLYNDYLTAQAEADNAVANGADEQTIINTAQAAQDAYGTYVTAQNAADAAYAGMTTDTSASADTQTYTETTDGYTETVAEEPAPAAPAASSAGQAIADYACQFVGNPYVYGGASLTGGADCSGFTMAVMANFGIGLPHNAAAQSGCGTPVSLDAIQPGDLLFYDGGGGIGHVTIYIGNGQVVHASNPTNGILISSIDYRTPVAARRFV